MSLSPEQAEVAQYILDRVMEQQGKDPRNAVEELRVVCVRLLDGTEALYPKETGVEPQSELPLESPDPTPPEVESQGDEPPEPKLF